MDSLVTLVRSSGASDSVGFISLLLCWIVFLAPISNVNLKLSSSRKHGDEIRRFQIVLAAAGSVRRCDRRCGRSFEGRSVFSHGDGRCRAAAGSLMLSNRSDFSVTMAEVVLSSDPLTLTGVSQHAMGTQSRAGLTHTLVYIITHTHSHTHKQTHTS